MCRSTRAGSELNDGRRGGSARAGVVAECIRHGPGCCRGCYASVDIVCRASQELKDATANPLTECRRPWDDLQAGMTPFQRAKLDLVCCFGLALDLRLSRILMPRRRVGQVMAYSVNTMFYVYLKAQGERRPFYAVGAHVWDTWDNFARTRYS